MIFPEFCSSVSAASPRSPPAQRLHRLERLTPGTNFLLMRFLLLCQIHRQDYVLGPGDARATEQPSVQRQEHQGVRVQPCDRVRPQRRQPSDLLQYCEWLLFGISAPVTVRAWWFWSWWRDIGKAATCSIWIEIFFLLDLFFLLHFYISNRFWIFVQLPGKFFLPVGLFNGTVSHWLKHPECFYSR